MKFASKDTIFQHKYSNINSSCISFLPLSNENFGQLKFFSTKYGFLFIFNFFSHIDLCLQHIFMFRDISLKKPWHIAGILNLILT